MSTIPNDVRDSYYIEPNGVNSEIFRGSLCTTAILVTIAAGFALTAIALNMHPCPLERVLLYSGIYLAGSAAGAAGLIAGKSSALTQERGIILSKAEELLKSADSSREPAKRRLEARHLFALAKLKQL